jgi:KDO2-lipid IV(A) lauroyltransferase
MSARAEMALPARWRPWQRRKNTAIYYGIRGLVAIARLTPYFLIRWIGLSLGLIGYAVAGRDRRRAVAQLKQAMPEIADPGRVIFRMFLHFGQTAASCLKRERFIRPGSPHVDFPESARQVLRGVLSRGKGCIFVSPHIGNWEILAQASTVYGFPCSTVGKETYDPRLTQMIADFRETAGLSCIWRGDRDVLRKIITVFKAGQIVGALIDQDTNVQAVFVPFFGRPASTPVTLPYLTCRYGAGAVFGHALWTGHGYRIHFEEVPVPKSGDFDRDAYELTADLTRRAEAIIRQHPEQWVWLHRRWKTQPAPEPVREAKG